MENIVVPWRTAEEKIPEFKKVFKHQIVINEFRDYIEQVIVGNDSQISPSIKRAIDIVSTIAVSSADAEKVFSLMN